MEKTPAVINLFKHFSNTASDTSVLVLSRQIRFQITAPLYLIPVCYDTRNMEMLRTPGVMNMNILIYNEERKE